MPLTNTKCPISNAARAKRAATPGVGTLAGINLLTAGTVDS